MSDFSFRERRLPSGIFVDGEWVVVDRSRLLHSTRGISLPSHRRFTTLAILYVGGDGQLTAASSSNAVYQKMCPEASYPSCATNSFSLVFTLRDGYVFRSKSLQEEINVDYCIWMD